MGDAPLFHYSITYEELGLGLSWWGSHANPQDQIVFIAHMGHIRTGRVCEIIVSFGVVTWTNLAMVEVVSEPFFLDVD